MSELQKLKREDLAEKDIKAFYVQLVDVFRTYLNKGKGLQSFSKTTDDLSMQVLDLNLRADTYNELVQTLRLSDAVKYAKFAPGAKENDHSLEIIQETINAIERR